MDALAKFFPMLASPEFLQTLVSIVLAAVVFFYFIYLLRKEETMAQADEEPTAADIGAKIQRHA